MKQLHQTSADEPNEPWKCDGNTFTVICRRDRGFTTPSRGVMLTSSPELRWPSRCTPVIHSKGAGMSEELMRKIVRASDLVFRNVTFHLSAESLRRTRGSC